MWRRALVLLEPLRFSDFVQDNDLFDDLIV
jgi:hypothetical protein